MGPTRKLIGATPVGGPDGKPQLDATGQPKVTGGQWFDFFMMPASVSVGVQVTLAGVATPAILAVMDAAGKSQAEQAAAAGAAAGSFFSALSTLGEEKVNKVLATLFQYVHVVDPDPERAAGGPKVQMDVDFNGKPKLMWSVVLEALKVNLGDFLSAGGGGLPSLPFLPKG